MADPRLKTLRIKTGVVKRLAKEQLTYEREVEMQKARIETYKNEGREEHYVRKQEEVLQESIMMVSDCRRRLVNAFEDLKNLLESEVELTEKEEYIAAQKVLEDSRPQLPSENVLHLC